MKNNKGFLLMESLIVAVFVFTIFSFLYRNLVPLMGEYERRYNYDDIDSVYAAHLFRNLLLADDNFDTLVAGVMDNPNIGANDITDCSKWSQMDLCNALKEDLNITPSPSSAANDGKIYVMRYELSKVKKLIADDKLFSSNTERGIRSYLTYLPNYTTDTVLTGYRLVIVRNLHRGDVETIKYANIEVLP